MHRGHFEHLAFGIPHGDGLRSIFNNAGSKRATLSERDDLAGDPQRIAGGQREALLLEQLRATDMHVDWAIRGLNAYMRPDRWNRRFRGIRNNFALQYGFSARIIESVGLWNRRTLLLRS